jgi:acyl carrier protein
LKVNSANDQEINLKSVGPEDMDDVLVKIEKSFNISLNDTSVNDVQNFGKLCDVVVEKVKKTNDGCTTQRAFYKLRNAINASSGHDKDIIKPQTKLVDLFPRDSRIEAVAAIEEEMGFQISLLQPKQWIVNLFSMILVVSFVLAFYYLAIGIAGMVVAGIGLKLAGRFGKEMHVKTIGDLAEKIAREHYLKCRRDASTVNKNEVSEKLRQLIVTNV